MVRGPPARALPETGVAVCDAIEDRDAMIASGMETGVVQGYAKLDRVLATLS